MNSKNILVSLDDIKMHFPVKKSFAFFEKKQFVKAVDGVSLDIYENETLGLVGESGCGKSTLGRVTLQLYRQTSGSVCFQGKMLNSLSKEELRRLRREMQIVFQDPYSSLNPKMTVGQLVSEALLAHKIYKRREKALESYTLSIMEKCGLQDFMLHRYPHQLSGGQRQRIGIARALALSPKFLVCDESVATLDVSIQSQIINLLLDIKEKNNLTYLFISHDLGTVRLICDRIAVMYLGSIVELAGTETLFESPRHPYTCALLNSIPNIDKKRSITPLPGDVPSPINPPSGCKFHPRCKKADEMCRNKAPLWQEINKGHLVACHYPSIEGEE